MQESTPSQIQLRLTIVRALELAYRRNSGLTAKLIHQAGPVTASVDQNGTAAISGKAGLVVVSITEVMQELGVTVRAITIMMTSDGKGSIRYNAEFKLRVAVVGVSGSIDVEKLVLSCSSLLCRAARLLNGRSDILDRQMLGAVGY